MKRWPEMTLAGGPVQATERTLREESYEYVVDRCPADGEETGEPS